MFAQKPWKSITFSTPTVLFLFSYLVLVVATVFASNSTVSEMQLKRNTDFGKQTKFGIFQKNPSEVILRFPNPRLLNINCNKNTSLAFSRCLLVCRLSVMFSSESEKFRKFDRLISYDQKCRNESRLLQLWTSLKTQKSQNQRWRSMIAQPEF